MRIPCVFALQDHQAWITAPRLRNILTTGWRHSIPPSALDGPSTLPDFGNDETYLKSLHGFSHWEARVRNKARHGLSTWPLYWYADITGSCCAPDSCQCCPIKTLAGVPSLL